MAARTAVAARRSRMAAPDRITFWVVTISGTAAAIYVSPVFLLTTFAVAAMIATASQRSDDVPASQDELPEFPASARTAIAGAMGELADGEARRLLLGVIVQARPIFAAHDALLDPAAERSTRDNAGALVEACCATALELSRLDVATTQSASPAARTQLVDRMKRAANALSSLYVAGLEHGSPASNRVSELVEEIVADASGRRAAASELNTLLGKPDAGV